MVCDRCKMAIEDVLAELELVPTSVQLGEVDLGENILEGDQFEQFREKIESLGFELINDRKTRLIENIKRAVIELVQAPRPFLRCALISTNPVGQPAACANQSVQP
jgi:hypothetical protein